MNGAIAISRFHRRQIMEQYESFASGFLDIDDLQIEAALTDTGRLESMCPEPPIQFKPSCEPGCGASHLQEQAIKAQRGEFLKNQYFRIEGDKKCKCFPPNLSSLYPIVLKRGITRC